MKAITIMQPWASLIACGAKRIETRSWKTEYRGPIAIHAAKVPAKISDELRDYIDDIFFYDYPLRRFINGIKADGAYDCGNLVLGKIIAIADLVDCVRMDGFSRLNCPSEWHIATDKGTLINIQEELYFGNYEKGNYAWILDNVRMIEPVPAKGKQRIWDWEPPEGMCEIK